MNGMIRRLQQAFDHAELHGDTERLDHLIADDFLSIRIERFYPEQDGVDQSPVHFTYHALDTHDMDFWLYDKTAIVRTIQTNRSTYQDQNVALTVRVSHVWVQQQDGQWRLAAIPFSPMEHG